MDDTGDGGRLADAEVAGDLLRAVVTGVEQFSSDARDPALAALSEHGVAEPRGEEWYPLAPSLAAIEAVDALVGEEGTFGLGRSLSRALAFPADATDVSAALATLDEAYGAHHRGDAGGYAFRQIGDDDGRVECHTPYPCAFDRGVVEGVAASFADGYVCLREVGVCRTDGAQRCTYEVTW
jgi:hypothetical protein